MNKLNKSLFAILVVFLLVSCACSVFAYSNQSSGEINMIKDDSVEDADEVISVSDDSSSDSVGSSSVTHVSLSDHATGNPLVLLLCVLSVIGFSTRYL